MFFAIITPLWMLLHVYVGRRLITTSSLSVRWKRVGWGVVLSLMLFAPLTMMVLRYSDPGPATAVFQWLTYLHMGFFLLLLFLVLVRDAIYVMGRLYERFALKQRDHIIADPARRRFLTNTANASILGATGLLSGVGYAQARSRADIKKVDIPFLDLHPDLQGFRIVQISDVHIGPTLKRDFLQEVVDAVNSLEPDMIAVTGDLIDGYVDQIGDQITPLSQLKAKHGAFFVTGNHEYYWDAPAWMDHIRSLGLTVLPNAHHLIEHGQGRLLIGGVNDYRAASRVEGHASDPHKALADAPDAHLKLLLAHQPISIFEAARAGFDLQLSGHTHGGQFFPITLFAGLAHPFTAGLGQHNNTTIYVSRGTGYWGPPMRLGAPSEITELTLTSLASARE